MIKGITLVSAVASSGTPGAEFDRSPASFPPSASSKAKAGRTPRAAAPPSSLPSATSNSSPAAPPPSPLLIEVTQLDHIHALVEKWLLADHRTEEIATLLSPVEPTHWNSRLFTVQLTAGA